MAEYPVAVAGESFFNPDGSARQDVIATLSVGEHLRLVPEPNNPHDHNAVLITTMDGRGIGYIAAGPAQWLSPMVQKRKPVAAAVRSLGIAENGGRGVVLTVFTDADARPFLSAAQGAPSPGHVPPRWAAPGTGKYWVMGGIGAILIVAVAFGPSKEEMAARQEADARAAAQQEAEATVEADKAAAAAQKALESATVVVSVDAVQRAYAANEAAAQQQYGKARMRVTGTIERIELDFSDKPYLVMRGGDNPFLRPQMHLNAEGQAKAPGLQRGQKVMFICTGASEVAGVAMLKDCGPEQ